MMDVSAKELPMLLLVDVIAWVKQAQTALDSNDLESAYECNKRLMSVGYELFVQDGNVILRRLEKVAEAEAPRGMTERR